MTGRRAGIPALCAAALLLAAGGAPAQAPKKLALVGGMLLDGYDVPPLHHAAVLIEGNKIVEVGRAGEIAIPPDAEVIDTSGRVMLPGLIDLHVHLNILGHGDYDRWDPWIAKNKLVETRHGDLGEAAPRWPASPRPSDLGGTLKESLASGTASRRERSRARACG